MTDDQILGEWWIPAWANYTMRGCMLCSSGFCLYRAFLKYSLISSGKDTFLKPYKKLFWGALIVSICLFLLNSIDGVDSHGRMGSRARFVWEFSEYFGTIFFLIAIIFAISIIRAVGINISNLRDTKPSKEFTFCLFLIILPVACTKFLFVLGVFSVYTFNKQLKREYENIEVYESMAYNYHSNEYFFALTFNCFGSFLCEFFTISCIAL